MPKKKTASSKQAKPAAKRTKTAAKSKARKRSPAKKAAPKRKAKGKKAALAPVSVVPPPPEECVKLCAIPRGDDDSDEKRTHDTVDDWVSVVDGSFPLERWSCGWVLPSASRHKHNYQRLCALHARAHSLADALKDFTLDTESCGATWDPFMISKSDGPLKSLRNARTILDRFTPDKTQHGLSFTNWTKVGKLNKKTVYHAKYNRMRDTAPGYDTAHEDDDKWHMDRFFRALRKGLRDQGVEEVLVRNPGYSSPQVGPLIIAAQTDDGDLFGVFNLVVWT